MDDPEGTGDVRTSDDSSISCGDDPVGHSAYGGAGLVDRLLSLEAALIALLMG